MATLTLAACLAACTREVATLPTDLAVAGRTNATPSLAAAGPFVAVTWGATASGGATDVFLAVSKDGGRSFASLVRVNDDASAANLAGEQPPHVALVPRQSGDPSVVVVWTTKAADGTRLVSARSDDGGGSFAAPAIVSGSEAAGNRGWQSVAVDGKGRVLAVWLDHRDSVVGGAMGATTNPAGASAHVHEGHATGEPMDGVARAQRSQLFFGSLDGSLPARGLTAGVCYCCKTALTVGASGAVYAAWRHVYEGNMRDIAFTMSRDGGRTFAEPTRISEDRWMLDGCPENGPAIAVDANDRVHAVWPTLVPSETPGGEPTMSLFYAASTDGRTFSPRQRIPTENVPRHPQIALDGGGRLTVAWDEQANGIRRVAIARAVRMSSGTTQFTRELVGAEGTYYPVVKATDDGIVVASTFGPAERSVIRVERRSR